MFEFLRKRASKPPEAEVTPEDYLLQADSELREAEREFSAAHLLVNQFYIRNRDYLPVTEVAGKVVLTIRPPNAELAALLSRENRSIGRRNRAMQRRAELIEHYGPKESRHIAGVRV
ncbi:MAG TPA: hypothetical protein VN902_03070 [Candidatus Acidoferrales bacterium]|nr:hypothetical protein [Candidatus Acidoferrales bacterium]